MKPQGMFHFILTVMLVLGSVAAKAIQSSVNNPQGDLWYLLESGQADEARDLENRLQQVLHSSAVERLGLLGGGDSKPWLVYFENNIVAVIKSEDPGVKHSAQNELAAYALDRALGLNMVPLTVSREIQGQNYTLQLYYPHQNSSQNSEYNSPRLADMVLFDFIIANIDRQHEALRNALIGTDGRLIAIDHSRAFYEASQYQHPLETEYLPLASQKFKDQLNGLNLQQLEKTLQEYLPKQTVVEVVKRIQYLQKTLQNFSGQDYSSEVTSKKRVKKYALPKALVEKPVYDVRDLPHILAGVGNPVDFLAQMSADRFNENSQEFQKVMQEWSTYPEQEKRLFLNLVLQMDEKMNNQKYIPAVVSRLISANLQDLPLLQASLSSEQQHEGYKQFIMNLSQTRFLDADLLKGIRSYLSRSRCEALFR
ncbi:hypothetical protein [Pseudobdellovibrio sp. HCB154]|uniref:hypothetical protein n=1 Tax=Pseudobdellovibrio sp. HCB154 TaxID=3386277 RepID=UPI0039176569